MPIKINDGFMCLEADGQVTATARRRAGGWQEASHWPRACDHNQAITALSITELLPSGRGRSHSVASALREKLR
jgi:hypothetical protein